MQRRTAVIFERPLGVQQLLNAAQISAVQEPDATTVGQTVVFYGLLALNVVLVIYLLLQYRVEKRREKTEDPRCIAQISLAVSQEHEKGLREKMI
jgi:hypothetical protein